jgi:hypothetical protein
MTNWYCLTGEKMQIVFARAELLKLEEIGQFPDEPVTIQVVQLHIVGVLQY